MAILRVVKMGDPLLRKVSESVDKEEIASEGFQQFMDDMVATMRNHNGAGIAAPQVGVPKRVFSMEMDNNPRYPDKESFPLLVVINPEIEALGETQTDSWEGCLSIPGIRGCLKRSAKIRLKGLDSTGKAFETTLDGFAAVVAQHELDHLDGKLFIDRMGSMETLSFQSEYETYWQ